jgi:hypothetical protein
MGRRRGDDALEQILKEWGRQRRVVLGLDAPKFRSQHLGYPTCTLDQIRFLRDGAGGATTRRKQHFPEVYTGNAVAVNRAFHRLAYPLRLVFDAHYVAHAPVSLKAEALALSIKTYFARLNQARAFVDGFIASGSPAKGTFLAQQMRV